MTQKYPAKSVFAALTSVWVALVLVCAVIPAYPILGTSAVITVSTILASALTAPLLGPLWGSISGVIYGFLAPYVNPATSIGVLTFLSPTMAAVMSGLVLFDRWKEASLILAAQLAIWFSHPFAWYQAMPFVTWEHWLAMALIVVPPVRKWIIAAVGTRNPRRLPIALWSLAWIARAGGDVITGNNIYAWILGFGTPSNYGIWAPLTLYYLIADSLGCLAGALIGTAVLLALKNTNMRIIAADFLRINDAK
jgi:hypothetical protein